MKRITSDIEKKLYSEAVFVFDTSAIGSLYTLVEDAKLNMLDILAHFADRLWIPAQVMVEYERNHEKFISETFNMYYKKNELEKPLNEVISKMKKIKDKYDEQNFHPYISNAKKTELFRNFTQLESAAEKIKLLMRENTSEREREKDEIKKNDRIQDFVASLNHGESYSFLRQLAIAQEGELRYRHSIPPGYLDQDKEGLDLYGDLFIWKQVLDYATTQHRDIIFITDDVKEDWWDKADGKLYPSESLQTEFKEVTGQTMWIYTLSSFISFLEQNATDDKKIAELFDGLEKVKLVLDFHRLLNEVKRTKDNRLIFLCNSCNHIESISQSEFEDLDWDVVSGYEGKMGTEFQYEDTLYHSCENCKHDITIHMTVWEYPIGVLDYQEILIDGGVVLSEINLGFVVKRDDDGYGTCARCGEYKCLGEADLCHDCWAEFYHTVNEKD